MKLTRRGGLLMTCSCSGAMTQSGMFLRILQATTYASFSFVIISITSDFFFVEDSMSFVIVQQYYMVESYLRKWLIC